MPRLIAGGYLVCLPCAFGSKKSDAATRARGAQPDAHQGLLAKLVVVETISSECPRFKKQKLYYTARARFDRFCHVLSWFVPSISGAQGMVYSLKKRKSIYRETCHSGQSSGAAWVPQPYIFSMFGPQLICRGWRLTCWHTVWQSQELTYNIGIYILNGDFPFPCLIAKGYLIGSLHEDWWTWTKIAPPRKSTEFIIIGV